MSDVFIVGPARSGTSWLQTMLAEHPDVASPPETAIFLDFITPVEGKWRRHREMLCMARADGGAMNVQGLATVLTSGEMQSWQRSLYDTARTRVLAGKHGATRLLEKTPDHAMCLDDIWRVVPDAQVVFLVRDPRATVRSLLHASAEPWGHWASTSVEGAADRWLRDVRLPLAHADDERLITVRYEDLRGSLDELRRVANFLGLGEPSTWMRTSIDASPRERQANIVVTGDAGVSGLATYDLEGFSFHDRTAQRELTPYETAYIEDRCREQMRALGYETRVARPPVAFRARRSARLAALRAQHYWRRYRARR